VEQTVFGKQLQLMSYNLLQLQLSSEHIPVTIVDISDLEPQDFSLEGRTGRATPREPLREMIAAIAEQQPMAIGVDIDFSPDENGFVHPHDPDFFQFCLDIQEETGIPVFLGIVRTVGGSPASWLGNEKYQGLAANIIIPRDSRRMVHLITMSEELPPGGVLNQSMPSRAMSLALAAAYGREARETSGWLRRIHAFSIGWLTRLAAIEKVSERRLGPGLAVEDFLVDFSPLESIEPLRTINPTILRDASQRKRFEGKVVLLGDATLGKATDTFLVPGRQDPYPGIFLHASAAYTVIKAPLFEVTNRGRVAIDVVFALAVLVAVLSIRLYYSRTQERVATYRLQGLFTLLVVVVALLGGVWFVRFTRVMWDDFLLALAALIFHPSMERFLGASWGRVLTSAPGGWRRLTIEGHEEKPK
jgi:hypothetical protein